MKTPEHVTPRWCFNCEAWRDVEEWNIYDNGCRCRTCRWVVNPDVREGECAVCKRPCEGWGPDNRVACSHACAYKIGRVSKATMIALGKLKESDT